MSNHPFQLISGFKKCVKICQRGGKICGNFQTQQEVDSMCQLQFCQDF